MINPGISSRQVSRNNCFFVGIGLKNPKILETTKQARCLTNKSQFLFKSRKLLKKRTSNDLSVEIIRYSKRNWIKQSGMKFIEFTTKVSKFPNFLYFRQHSPNFGLFPKIYFNQKDHRIRIETSSYR